MTFEIAKSYMYFFFVKMRCPENTLHLKFIEKLDGILKIDIEMSSN